LNRLPAERVVFLSGVASIVFGLIALVPGAIRPPGPGSLGLAPTAVAGLGAILLGGIALIVAAPGRERSGRAWQVWVLLGLALLATVAVVLLALDAFGVPIGPIGRIIVFAGVYLVIDPGVVLMFTFTVVLALWVLAQRIRRALGR
jgi:hypothetical protein